MIKCQNTCQLILDNMSVQMIVIRRMLSYFCRN